MQEGDLMPTIEHIERNYMKKHYKSCLFVITLLTALYLTACSTATDADTYTAETEISVSDTLIGTANNTSKITEGEEKILRQYSSYLFEKSQTDELFHAIKTDTADDPGLASIIAFCDIDLDNVPELFAGYHNMRGYCYYSVYGSNGIIADEISCGMCNEFLLVGNACYSNTHDPADKAHHWLQISDAMPKIMVQDCDDNTTFNVTVTSDKGNYTQNGITLEEADNIFKQVFGVTYTELKGSSDNYVKCSLGHLEVPDPENYTEEDIYDCLLGLLQEYENQEQE